MEDAFSKMSLSTQTQEKIQAALDAGTKDTGVPGMAFIAVDKKGGYLTKQASGRHGLNQDRKIDEDSVFWIASCTKMVTAIACLQLVEQGKLKLDDHNQVYELLPEVKAKDQVLVGKNKWEPRKNDITLRMLLNHTAGFGYSFFNENVRDYGRPTGFDEFDGDFKTIQQMPLVNQPGSKWEYGVSIASGPSFKGHAADEISQTSTGQVSAWSASAV